MTSNIWISIEGNISSGKTTLLSFLKRQAKEGKDFGLKDHDIYFIDEDMEAWGADVFALYYSNPARWALSFQVQVIAIRAMQMRRVKAAIEASGRPGLVISERSLESSKCIFTKMCCEADKINEVEKRMYDNYYKAVDDIGVTSKYIYCTTPPELCQERYIKRAREGETLDLDYLKSCHKAHLEWLKNGLTNVLEIDTSEEISEEALNRWYDQICKSLGSCPIDQEVKEQA